LHLVRGLDIVGLDFYENFMECFMTKLVNILKKPVAVAGLLSVALASGVASADFNPKFYVGAGVDYAKYGLHDNAALLKAAGVKIKDKGMGLVAPILGVKFNENFGLEAGYSFNKKISVEGVEIFKVRNAYLDLMGYMPVADQIELIGGVGIGRLMAKKGTALKNVEDLKVKNSFGWRLKAGAQYNFNNNIGIRALVGYQSAGTRLKDSDSGDTSEKIIKSMASIGLAATYTF